MSLSRISMSDEGPTTSRIVKGFGGALRWNMSPREIRDHVRECVDLGVTTLDIAAAYGGGKAEPLLGEALALDAGLRDKVEIVTKCGIGTWGTSLYHYDTSKEHILWSADQSLSRLRTDRIDVLLIHRADPLMDADEVADAYTTLRQSGKVLHFGVSNLTPSQFELLASRLDFPLVTNEIEFSAMHLDACRDGTLDLCQRRRISPLAWSPLGAGRLFRDETDQTKRLRGELQVIGEEHGGASIDQVALAWIIRHPVNAAPILGTSKIERVRSAAQAETIQLSREQYFRIWTASTGTRLP